MSGALARIAALRAKAPPGPWRLWGMEVRASTCPERCADLDHSVVVASTYATVDGHPRTFVADFIAAAANLDWQRLSGIDEEALARALCADHEPSPASAGMAIEDIDVDDACRLQARRVAAEYRRVVSEPQP